MAGIAWKIRAAMLGMAAAAAVAGWLLRDHRRDLDVALPTARIVPVIPVLHPAR